MKKHNRNYIAALSIFALLPFVLAGAVVKRGPNQSVLIYDSVVFCGQLVDVGNVQTFLGPAGAAGESAHYTNLVDWQIGGATCNGMDSEVEATADNPIGTNYPSVKMAKLRCITSMDPTNDVTFTLRSATANLSPSITCTVSNGGGQNCSSTYTGALSDVGSGATLAIKVDYTEDLDAEDAWCKAYFLVE